MLLYFLAMDIWNKRYL